VATALKNGLDDEVVVWFEPLFDTTGSKPHFIVLMPDNGIAVLEVLDVRSNKLLGAVRGLLRDRSSEGREQGQGGGRARARHRLDRL